ncbi:MAG: rhodanese-like domain-containing protein [Thermoleophilia bacterium]
MESTSRTRGFIDVLLIVIAAVFASTALSCGGSSDTASDTVAITPTATQAKTSTLPKDQILAKRGNAVFASILGDSSNTPGNLVTAKQLNAMLQNPVETEKLFVLDTRPRNEWDEQGHIESATWIKMQDVADPENLEKLPRDKMIVCVSPTGHTAVQVASVLRWLGYDAVALKHGMAAWTQTPAGKLMISDVEGGIAKRYPVATEAPYTQAVTQEPSQKLTAPPDDETAVLTAAAQRFLHEDVYEKEYPFNHIFSDDLYRRMSDPAQIDSIFLLDIRPLDSWQRDGHIDMGAHILIDWRVLGDVQNLALLPKDKLIVVIGATGQTAGQVTAVLRMMGYNAVTLRSGMTAWTETPDSQDTRTTINGANYPVVQ